MDVHVSFVEITSPVKVPTRFTTKFITNFQNIGILSHFSSIFNFNMLDEGQL